MLTNPFRPVVALLAWLLTLANADPPFCRKREFYALKKRLLARYGRRTGHTWQEFTKYCYGCEGTGQYRRHWDDDGEGDECRRCGGTGVYDLYWCFLERWELAGRPFYVFSHVSRDKPNETEIGIKGKIIHTDHGRAADEAALWLALLCDRPLFVRLLCGSRVYGPTWRYPLLSVQKLIYGLEDVVERCRRRLRLRHCIACGRSFRVGFRNLRYITHVCPRCDQAERVNRSYEMPS